MYWDLNDNDASNVGEGISDVTMLFSNEILPDNTIESGNNGDWELFVPANTIWEINTSYDGFESIQQSISVSDVPNDVLLELTAGLIHVSGNISYDLGITSIPEGDVVLTIIPTEGIVRDTVTPLLFYGDEGWLGNWSAQLEPGLWIVSASVPSQDLVVMGLINVDVTDGGNLDMELTRGGILDVNTEWLDYDGVSRNLGEIIDGNIVIDIGFGMKWIQDVETDGSLNLLLPNGNVEFSSDFDVEQRGITMEYMAGRGTDVYSGQESPVLSLLYNRVSNHEIIIQTLNLTSGHESYIGSTNDVNLVVNETDGFVPVEFTLGVEYLGHESYDLYTVGGIVSGSDSTEWTLEFNNGSGWNTSTQFEVGLDNAQTFDDLNIRVTPANQSVAHAFDDGHMITILISTQDGYQDTHELTVRVPQLHGFELTNPMKEVYGVSPGELIIVPIEFTNAGNGDDKYEFEFDDSELPEGWSRTGPTSHTLGGFVSTTHSVTVVAPETSSNEEFSIYVTATDKAGNSYETIEINIRSSEPILKIEGAQALGGGEPEAGGQITYIATVSNTGLVEAKQVQLNATLCNDVSCNNPTSVSTVTTMDIGAESTMQFSFLFDLSDITVGPYYLVMDINSSIFGEDNINDDSWHVSDGIFIGSWNIDVRSPAANDDEGTDIIAPILIVILVGIFAFLTKGRSRRPGAPF